MHVGTREAAQASLQAIARVTAFPRAKVHLIAARRTTSLLRVSRRRCRNRGGVATRAGAVKLREMTSRVGARRLVAHGTHRMTR
jgi:hypothetical protein